MLIMRSVIALDKKTIALSNTSTNINEVPGWIEGESLSLSKWNVDLILPQDTIHLTNLAYPIEVHHEFTSTTSITNIRLFRTVGTEELFFQLTPQTVQGDILDLRIEFMEQNDT